MTQTPLRPGLTCVLAPNPSPMTHNGTNSYLLGERALALIDPGPDLPAHRDALLAAIAGRPVSHIIVTHSHLDHSPLARPLSQLLQAPVLGFGDSLTGRSAVMQQLANKGLAGGGEGVDTAFCPDERLADGAVLRGADWTLTALHTPGHMGNHISLLWQDAAFCGDLVMGWASSLVSPPDGDLADFLGSCARLRGLNLAVLYPGHGAPVTDPAARIDWLISHRAARSAQILQALAEHGPASLAALTARVYADVPEALHPAAARNLFAHLVHLTGTGAVAAQGAVSVDAVFARV